ncbi:MAG: ATP-binding protein, partial [Pseudomonadota bacterium]|nr:ATP-binding protein [Pseudomonadota bacterium]
SILRIIPPERHHEEATVLERLRKGVRIDSFETVRRRKDGSYVHVSLSISPIRHPDGRIIGASKMARDITTRRRSQARDRFLVELDDAIRPLEDAAEIISTAARAVGEVLGVNRCAYATVEADQDSFFLSGNYTHGVGSIVGYYTFRQFGEECLRSMRAGLPYVVSDAENDPRVTETERPSYRAAEIAGVICVPIRKAGRCVAAMAVHTRAPRSWLIDEVELMQQVASRCWESIERARVTESLRESERQFRELANSIPNLAWMAASDGWIEWFNDQWLVYTGRTHQELQRWGWQDVQDPAVSEVVNEGWRRSIATGRPFEMIFPLRAANGEYRRFLTRINPVRDSRGHVVQWFGTSTDIENEQRATEALAELRLREETARKEAEQMREVAERANRTKDEFLAMLGHELRNPLSPILTALQLMKLRGDDGQERERTVIERQVSHLTRLVDDLLDVSRIAQGKVELKEELVELWDVVSRAIETASPLLEQRAHTLHVEVPRRGLVVRADPTRLSQVISNLLTNAAKYTGPGGRISLLGALNDGDVELRVKDNGIGIPSEVLPRVFDLFTQGAQALDRAEGGLGLGLTIVRSLVQRHGGAVSAHSAGPGEGSEFVVSLPAAAIPVYEGPGIEAMSDMEGTTGATPTPLRILVVDDNEDSAEMLALALSGMGFETRMSIDAPSALRVAEEFEPNIAILDLGLPVMDGFELAGRLRALPGLSRIRLIALTGYGQESDRQRTRAAGFDHHLVKPVDLFEVRKVVSEPA